VKLNTRLFVNILWLLIGAVLIGLSFAGIVDEYWNGMGMGLGIVGAINLLRIHRLNKNDAYREKRELEMSDERNQFIRNKAWAWAGYYFILLAGIGTIVFKIIGQDMLSQAAAYAVCLIMILYWICYHILKRKY
jgi:Na+/H+ antiporter NhaD/arsenite permease-like protein